MNEVDQLDASKREGRLKEAFAQGSFKAYWKLKRLRLTGQQDYNSQTSNRKGDGEIVHNVDTFFGLGNVGEGVLRILYTNAD